MTEDASIRRCTWRGACPPSNHPGEDNYSSIYTSTVVKNECTRETRSMLIVSALHFVISLISDFVT